MRYVGVCPYGVASRSGTRHPEVGRRSRHIDMDHLPGRQFDDEKGTKPTEEFTRPSQECLRLDEEQRLFPGSDHPGAARTRRNRSVFRYTGRLTCRRRTIRGTRKSAFSASSSPLLLVRSASVLSTREVVD